MSPLRLLLCKTLARHEYRYAAIINAERTMACGIWELTCVYCGQIAPGWEPK